MNIFQLKIEKYISWHLYQLSITTHPMDITPIVITASPEKDDPESSSDDETEETFLDVINNPIRKRRMLR